MKKTKPVALVDEEKHKEKEKEARKTKSKHTKHKKTMRKDHHGSKPRNSKIKSNKKQESFGKDGEGKQSFHIDRHGSEIVGGWFYASSENSDEEKEKDSPKRKKPWARPNWIIAAKRMDPLTHDFKISLPSGLLIEVKDVIGPPITREVKQSYSILGKEFK